MNSVRRTPPRPAPSRIRGTLKLQPKSPDEEAGSVPPPQSPPRTSSGAARPRPEPAGQRVSSGAERAADSAAKAHGQRPDDSLSRQGRRSAGGPAPARPPRQAVQGQAASQPPGGRAPLAAADAAQQGVRLSKLMAERGLCSRREADEFIERGWVLVDGRRVSQLGIRVATDARIELAPEATRAQHRRVTILLHKPVGYVSGQPEPGHEPAIALIGADNQFDRERAQRFQPAHLRNLAPAGRLDIDSTGLLVLTQDGRTARRLIGENSTVDKEYLVRVSGKLIDNGLALLRHGLSLDERPLQPAEVEWLNQDQLRFVLREGRKRQIRRMCELVGLRVIGLKRVRIGGVRLGDLPLGQWRFLRDDEPF